MSISDTKHRKAELSHSLKLKDARRYAIRMFLGESVGTLELAVQL